MKQIYVKKFSILFNLGFAVFFLQIPLSAVTQQSVSLLTWLIVGMFPVGIVVSEDIVDLLAVIPVDVLYVGAE